MERGVPAEGAEIVARRVGFLTDYQNAAYAKRYVALVGNAVVGQRLEFSRGNDFVRVDGTNAVARAELGLAH